MQPDSASQNCLGSCTDALESYEALSGLERLHIASPSIPVTLPNRCLLFEVPAELRNSIYEIVLRRDPPLINVDLSHAITPRVQAGLYTFSIAMTCRGIHNECAKVLYAVNHVDIYAPVFSAHQSDPMTIGATYKDEIAARLRTMAQRQVSLQQLQDVKIHLGTLPPLRALRWMGFFGSWWCIHDSLVSLRQHVPRMEISFDLIRLGNGKTRLQFRLANAEDVSAGFQRGVEVCRKSTTLTEIELDKLRKIEATIIKTLFPPLTS